MVRDAIVHECQASARDLNPEVPPELEVVINRALAKDREQRYQSAAEVCSGLQKLNSHKSNPVRRQLRWKVLAAVSAAALVAALFWLSRPLRPPRITATTQLTNEGIDNGAPLLTDGARLFFNLSLEPRQISVKGGPSSPLQLPFPNPSANRWVVGGDGSLVDVSPDRTEFLIWRWEDGSEDGDGPENIRLWVAPIAGGYPRRLGNLLARVDSSVAISALSPTPHRSGLADPHLSSTAWSPDGQLLVYPKGEELHLARSDGTEIRKLATFEGTPFFVRWAPDGRSLRVSVSTQADSASTLWEVAIDNGRMRPLLPGWNPSWYTCCGNWTPDGKYFVFQSRANIWALREKTGFFQRASPEPVQLTAGLMEWYWPLPSLDGKRLFVAGYDRRNEFLRYDLQSRHFTQELAGVSGTTLDFSRDGKSMVYVSVPEGLLFSAAADGHQRRQLTWPPLTAASPRLSPDGKQIAFAGTMAGKPSRIYVVSSEGGEPRQVSNGESGKFGDSDPYWSPDGASLVFGGGWSVPLAEKFIQLLDLKANHISALPGSTGMWSPRWAPDGHSIAGAYGGPGPTMLLKLYDLKAQKQTQLSDLAIAYPEWSLDGEFLFFESDHDKWVWRVRIRDRKAERIVNLNDIDVAGWGWYAVAPNNSLLTAHAAGGQQIYALDWEAP